MERNLCWIVFRHCLSCQPEQNLHDDENCADELQKFFFFFFDNGNDSLRARLERFARWRW